MKRAWICNPVSSDGTFQGGRLMQGVFYGLNSYCILMTISSRHPEGFLMVTAKIWNIADTEFKYAHKSCVNYAHGFLTSLVSACPFAGNVSRNQESSTLRHLVCTLINIHVNLKNMIKVILNLVCLHLLRFMWKTLTLFFPTHSVTSVSSPPELTRNIPEVLSSIFKVIAKIAFYLLPSCI